MAPEKTKKKTGDATASPGNPTKTEEAQKSSSGEGTGTAENSPSGQNENEPPFPPWNKFIARWRARSRMSKFDIYKVWRDTLALLIAVVGICITISKCNENIERDRKNEAIKSIYLVKDKGLLDAMTRLAYVSRYLPENKKQIPNDVLDHVYEKDIYEKNFNQMLYDFNHVFNAYDNIGVLYDNELLNRRIIINTICPEIRQFDATYQSLKDFLPATLNSENFVAMTEACKKLDSETAKNNDQ